MILLLVGIVIALLCWYLHSIRNNNEFTETRIPHLKPVPIVGNFYPVVLRLRSYAHVSQQVYKVASDALYIGFYGFQADARLMIRDPDLVKRVMVKDFECFMDRKSFVNEDVEPLLANTLFSLTGMRWKETRTILSPSFTTSKIKSMYQLVNRCADNFVDYVGKLADDELDVKDAITRYSNDSIATSAFGLAVNSMEDRENLFYSMARKFTQVDWKMTIKFFIGQAFPKLAEIVKLKVFDEAPGIFFRSIIEETVKERRAKGVTRPDMIQQMIQERPRTNDTENKFELSYEDMTAQAMIFIFGGLDTTSTTLSFIIHELAVNPEVQARLRNEIDETLEKCGGEIDYDRISEMKYLEAVINETLRLYPSFPDMERVCTRTIQLPPSLPHLPPYTLQVGTCITIPIYAIQRDEKYFVDPDKFDPERFNEANKGTIQPFTYFPFGQGPRNCIGIRFAFIQMKVVIIKLLKNFSIEPCAKTCIPMVLTKKTMAMQPDNGFWVKIRARGSKTS